MTDETDRKRRMAKAAHLKPHQFQPGQCANPSGRPRGARNKLTERFLEDLHAAWQKHGEKALETLAENDPGKLATIVAGLVPKDVHINVGLGDQLAAMLEAMQAQHLTVPAGAWVTATGAGSVGGGGRIGVM